MKKKKMILLLFMTALISLSITACYEYKEPVEVQANCIKKEYKESYKTTSMMMVGKTPIITTKDNPERYEVTLGYNGTQKVINSKSLYESVEELDKVDVLYYETEDKKYTKITYEE